MIVHNTYNKPVLKLDVSTAGHSMVADNEATQRIKFISEHFSWPVRVWTSNEYMDLLCVELKDDLTTVCQVFDSGGNVMYYLNAEYTSGYNVDLTEDSFLFGRENQLTTHLHLTDGTVENVGSLRTDYKDF